MTPQQESFLIELHQCQVILFGKVIQAKYGMRTPVYLDMRENIYREPELMWRVGRVFADKIKKLAGSNPVKQIVVGVPDTATPLALSTSLYAWKEEIAPPAFSYLLLRKESKQYKDKAPSHIIGDKQAGDSEYNLIDDVMASGLSKWRSAQSLLKEGVKTRRMIVFLDREQGGSRHLRDEGHEVHSIFRLSEVVDFYLAQGILDPQQHSEIRSFQETHQFQTPLWQRESST